MSRQAEGQICRDLPSSKEDDNSFHKAKTKRVFPLFHFRIVTNVFRVVKKLGSVILYLSDHSRTMCNHRQDRQQKYC